MRDSHKRNKDLKLPPSSVLVSINQQKELVFGAKIWIYRDPFEGIWFWSGKLEVCFLLFRRMWVLWTCLFEFCVHKWL
ncbi:hypothetical protein IMY05_001G0261500 [Salix suchowensis]|nr:hypothetical protein IMY05_001G0261500 [Salix suchowensis]